MTDQKFQDGLKEVPPLVRQMLDHLHKVREKALVGVYCHNSDRCPIAKGFGIRAVSRWIILDTDGLMKLQSAGVKPAQYESFIEWYDDRFQLLMRADLLKHFLSSPSLPS